MTRMMAVLITLLLMTSIAFAEDNAWALCKTYVNIRMHPSTKSMSVGRLYCGDGIETDGVYKDGWMHCINLLCEMDEGWIYAGYMTDNEPEQIDTECKINANGRVALRNQVNGDRIAWIQPGGKINVLWKSDEWSLTSRGYIKTEFLEFGR